MDGSNFKDQDSDVERTSESIDVCIANRGEATIVSDKLTLNIVGGIHVDLCYKYFYIAPWTKCFQ